MRVPLKSEAFEGGRKLKMPRLHVSGMARFRLRVRLAVVSSGARIKAKGHGRSSAAYRTPIGGRGGRLPWLLFADSDSPLSALALALPVRLRTFLGLV